MKLWTNMHLALSKYLSNINVFATGLDEKNYSELKYVDLISEELSLNVNKTIINKLNEKLYIVNLLIISYYVWFELSK